jgi:hypothetical protein
MPADNSLSGCQTHTGSWKLMVSVKALEGSPKLPGMLHFESRAVAVSELL